MDEWASSAEQIAISQIINGTRLIGFVSPTAASSTSLFARMVSEAMGRAGLKILLANLNATQEVVHETAAVAVSEPWRPISDESNRLLDMLSANVTAETKPLFNNNGWLGSFFAEQLRTYSTVILDLPPLIQEHKNKLSPLAAASICQGIVLMCPTGGVTRAQVSRSLQLLQAAEVSVIGLVVEEGREQFGWRNFRSSANGPEFPHAQKRP